jgi:hypothetical protein
MTLAAHVLRDDGLRAAGNGFEVDVRLNWYRSLPLSSVETLELTVNGKTIPRDEITFAVNGKEFALDELAARWEEVWFVLDPATVRVARPLVRPGDAAEIRLVLGNRIPYLLVGPGKAFEYVTDRTATVVARPAA